MYERTGFLQGEENKMQTYRDMLNQIIAFKKESLLENSNNGIPIIVFSMHYLPLEILEASNTRYLTWEWFIELYGCSEEYIKNQVVAQYFPKDFCIFSRAVFALEIRKPSPKISQMFAVYTCDPITKMYEYLEKVFPVCHINLPRWKNNNTMELWISEIYKIKGQLEKITKQEISIKKLEEIIFKEMDIHSKLREICKKRTFSNFPLKSSDLFRLYQLRYLLNQEEYLRLLNQTEMFVSKNSSRSKSFPIIFLLGAPLIEIPPSVLMETFGGPEIIEFIESFGVTTIEEPWREILFSPSRRTNLTDPIKYLAKNYYERPKGAYMIPNFERKEENIKVAELFKVAGVVYFNYRGCRVFLAESKRHGDTLKEKGIPFLHLDLTGEKSEIEQLRTRIESFLYSTLERG